MVEHVSGSGVDMLSARDQYIGHMQGLIHEVLGPLVPDGPFALIDFPDIKNVGDSAIWVGEIAYLRERHGRAPAYVSALNNLDPAALERAVPDGPIFLHGGGNLGDIWLGHQIFREKALQRWPNRTVVQLPQSIHFNSIERAEEAARVIEKHKDFILLLRDQPSMEFAQRHFQCKAVLCPDMAFAIGAIAPTAPVEFPVLAMLRKDKEQVVDARSMTTVDYPVEDWITEDPGPVRRARMLGRLAGAATLSRARVRVSSYNAVADTRLGRGVRQLSRAHKILTDRLHVHIISTLMGKPHAVLDNSYGKIGRFRAAFPEPDGLTFAASSLDEALEWARQDAGAQAIAA